MDVLLMKFCLFPLSREALGEDPESKKLVEEEQSRSHKQIEESRQVRAQQRDQSGSRFCTRSALLIADEGGAFRHVSGMFPASSETGQVAA